MNVICPSCGLHIAALHLPRPSIYLAWTPADVEAETQAGYYVPVRSFELRNHPPDAWNRAVSLGGEHYEAWRKAHIEPLQQRINAHTLWRHQITRLIEYERKWITQSPSSDTPASAQEPLDIHQEFQQIRDEHARIKRSLASDTPACDQTPPPGSAPRRK